MAGKNTQMIGNTGVSPRRALGRLPLYNAGISAAVARRVSGRDDVSCLGSNENPYGPSPAVSTALCALVPSRYSDPTSADLREALSEKLGIGTERIVCGNGSEELIAAVCRAYIEQGDTVLTVSPCFGLHEIEPMAAGAQVTKVPMTGDLDFDIDALVKALAHNPKLFFISSPSNPVGRAMSEMQLSRLLGAVQPGTLLVLDEAYFEFIDADFPDGLRFLMQSEDVSWALLRTFSKAYGLAGLRVGYAVVANAEIARALRNSLTPFNVNAAAQTAAVAALRDRDWMRETTSMLRRDRNDLADQIHRLGLKAIPSQANFLFVDLGVDAAPVAHVLLRNGVVVKPWTERGYESYVRVTIGTAKDNERFVQELGSALGFI